MLRLIPVMLMALVCGAAQGQSLYKCTVKGKVTYSGAPCKEGQEKAIDVPAAPQADTNLAQEREREKVALSNLEKARSERETQEKGQRVDHGAVAHEQRCAKLRLEKQQADANAEGAPGRLKASRADRAQRAGDALAVECQP
jgi:hypothetical protein